MVWREKFQIKQGLDIKKKLYDELKIGFENFWRL